MGENSVEQRVQAFSDAVNKAHAENAETVVVRMDELRPFVEGITRAISRLTRIETAARELIQSLRFTRVPPTTKLYALREALETEVSRG